MTTVPNTDNTACGESVPGETVLIVLITTINFNDNFHFVMVFQNTIKLTDFAKLFLNLNNKKIPVFYHVIWENSAADSMKIAKKY